jgi:protease IV
MRPLFLVLLSQIAIAQTATVATNDVSRGVNLLPVSTAFNDEATSISRNPAGLSRTGSFNLWYVHEKSNTRGLDADGIYAATSFGPLAAGISFEWMRPVFASIPNRAKTSVALAGGMEWLSFGGNFNWFFMGESNPVLTADLGIQLRPWRAVSVGIQARNLNAPKSSAGLLPREFVFGVGVRPFGERLTVGVDYFIRDDQNIQDSRMQYTLAATVFRGIRVGAGVSHGFSPTIPLMIQGTLGIDFEHFGYTQGVSWANDKLNWQFAARLSADSHQSIAAPHQVAIVSMSDVASAGSSTLGAIFGESTDDRFVRLLNFLDAASNDDSLDGLVLKMEGVGVGMARADELHAAILKLRAKGKKVFSWVLSANDADYLVMSACDGIYAASEAMWMVDGLKSTHLFFGSAAEKLGVKVDVARVGAFKNAPDQYTRSDMSPEQREAATAYLKAFTDVMSARVSAARKISATDFQTAIDEGLISTKRAVALKLIDGVMTPKQFDEFVGAQFPTATVSRSYSPKPYRDTAWRSQKSIALISVNGSIAGGKNQSAPIGGDLVAGAQSFIQSLGAAVDDDDVAAIVLRIDSPGGDGLASDLMYRAVLEAKKKKPIVVSMGDVAASGGYYVAMGADTILASKSTITGSIGVFFVKPSVKELAQKFGVNQESISTGKRAGITDLYEPWSDDQREAAQKWVDEFYDGFITEVAASRHLEKSVVDTLARGRVWSGVDALERKLIDAHGGLVEAIALAKSKTNLASESLEVKVFSAESGPLIGLTSLLSTQIKTASNPWPVWMSQIQNDMATAAKGIEPGIRAQLEFGIRVE